MEFPSLSVIIPNYNHGKYLSSTLEGVLSQSVKPSEVIVVDDGSSDNSIEVIESFRKKNKTIILLKNKNNQGVVYSLNRALSIASSEYVTFPSADNLVFPSFYEQAFLALVRYPQSTLCFSDPMFLDDKTGLFEKHPLRLSNNTCYFSSVQMLKFAKKGIFVGNVCHTIVVKRKTLQEFGRGQAYYLPELKWLCDFFAITAISLRYGACYIPKTLAALRIISNSYSGTTRTWDQKKSIYFALMDILLLKQNDDIKIKFKQAGILHVLGSGIIRSIYSNLKKYKYFLDFLLIRKVFFMESRKAFGSKLKKFSPMLFKKVKDLNSKFKSIFIKKHCG